MTMPLSRLDAAADLYEQRLTGPRTFLIRDNDELTDLSAYRETKTVLACFNEISAFLAGLDDVTLKP